MSSQELSKAEVAATELTAVTMPVVSEDNKAAFEMLLNMLTYKRPHGSRTERRFITRFIAPLGITKDKFGNLYKCIGDNPNVMWSSHTDTVHRTKGMQMLGFDKNEVGLAASEKDSNCLGADDGAGVWLMVQMIMANKPGLYVFHRAEEGGRKGSIYIANNHKDLIKDLKFCIALDRRAKGSIITHQMGDRCCSEAFSKSFAAELNLDFKSDDTGSFTDSASYTDIIGECTNLSVGYNGAHGGFERQDVDYIFRVRDALLKANTDNLESSRKPGDKERKTYGSYQGSNHNSGGTNGWYYGSPQYKHLVYMNPGDEDAYVYIGGVKKELDMDYYNAAFEKRKSRGEIGKQPTKTINEPLMSEDMFSTDGNLIDASDVGGEPGAVITVQPNTIVTSTTTALTTEESNRQLADLFATGKVSIHEVPVSLGGTKDDDDELDDDESGDAAYGISSHETMVIMQKLVGRNPEPIADILEQMGYDATSLRDEIMGMYGVCNF